jgi:ParB-like chromosome segregation protein Spo0J
MQRILGKKGKVNLADLKLNDRNPRTIGKEAFEKLRESIKRFPKMMAVRGIVVDADGIVIGGTQRYRACVANGMKEVPSSWVQMADDFTESERRQFIIADNAPFGEWNWDMLANEGDAGLLDDFGLDVPVENEENNKNTNAQSNQDSFYKISIECKDESEMEMLLDEFTSRGLKCQSLIY